MDETELKARQEKFQSVMDTYTALMGSSTKSATALKKAEELRIKQLAKLLDIEKSEAEELVKRIKAEEDATDATKKHTKALQDAAGKAIDTLGGFAKGALSAAQSAYNTSDAFAGAAPMLKVVGEAIKGVSTVIATAFSSIPFIGGVFSAADKAVALVTDISIQVMEMQLQNAQKYVGTYAALSKVGMTFGGSLDKMQEGSAKAGLSLQAYSKFLTESAVDLYKMGGGITVAGAAVSKMGKNVIDSNKQLVVMYGGYAEVNSALATYSARLGATGYNTIKNQDKVNAGAQAYLYNLKMMTDLTGMTAAAMQAAEEERLQEADYQAAKLAMGDKGLLVDQAMLLSTAGLGKELTKYAAEYFANGQIISESGQKIESFNGAAARAARDMVDLARTGIPVDEFNKKAAAILDGSAAAIKAQYNLDIAKLKRGTDNPEVAAIAQATQQLAAAQAFRENAEESVAKLKADREKGKGDKSTDAYADLIKTMNDNQMSMDKITQKGLKNAAEMANTMYNLQKILLDKFGSKWNDVTANFTKSINKLLEMLGPEPDRLDAPKMKTIMKDAQELASANASRNEVLSGRIGKKEAGAILENGSTKDINSFGGKKYLESIVSGGPAEKPDFTGAGGAESKEANVGGVSGLAKIKALIKAVESDSAGGYNAMQGFAGHGGLTTKTIGEILKLQDARTPGTTRAAGAYQMMPDTLRTWMRLAGLKESDLFDQTNQEKMVDAFFAKPQFRHLSDKQAQLRYLAQIWRGLPGEENILKGMPTDKVGNKAGIGWKEAISQMASGGIVSASSGGSLVNVGEGGSNELITPLKNGRIPGMDELITKFDKMINIMQNQHFTSEQILYATV